MRLCLSNDSDAASLDVRVWGPDAQTEGRLLSHGEAAFGSPVHVERREGRFCMSPRYRFRVARDEDTPEARQRLLRFLSDDAGLPPCEVL